VKQSKFYISLIISLFLCLFGLIASISLGLGGFDSGFLNLFFGSDEERFIVTQIRLPRAIAAIVAGFGLAISGAVLQNILKNPLASPFTVGVSQAAAFGATFAIIVLGVYDSSNEWTLFFGSQLLVIGCAFLSALILLALLTILYLKRLSSSSVILSGIAFGALFSSLVMLMQFFGDDLSVAATLFWSFGDLSKLSLEEGVWLLLFISSFYALASLLSFKYNILNWGEKSASALGLNVGGFFILSIALASVLAGVVTAFFGVIGFVGIVAPHIVRLFFGEDYKAILMISPVIGATLLLVSDIIARVVISPLILPIGIVTSLIGAPLFLLLLIKKGRAL